MKNRKKLFMFGLQTLVGKNDRGFFLKPDAKLVFDLLTRKGDDAALVVLGRAPEKMEAIEYLERRGIKFPTMFTGIDHDALQEGMRALVRHHHAKRSFCIHNDPKVLAIARRIGAKRISLRDHELTDVKWVETMADIAGYYNEL